jgi:sirohydrochlorin ferrochelatase
MINYLKGEIMQVITDKLNKDISDLKDAMNKFILEYGDDKEGQAATIAYTLRDLLENNEFKSVEDYEDSISDSYYDSDCTF